jgi:ABC-type spermidine/putrescine transport system permease subunit I
VALLHSRVLWAAFIATAVIHFLNLYHVFSYYYLFAPNEMQNYPGWTQFDWLYNDFIAKSDILGFEVPLLGTGFENRLETVQLLAILLLVSFLAMFPAAYLLAEQQRHKEKPLEGA